MNVAETERRQLERIIAIPSRIRPRDGQNAFADGMADFILTTAIASGAFLPALNLAVDRRASIAQETGETDVMLTLLHYTAFRCRGLTAPGKHGASFTRVADTGPLCELYALVRRRIFANPRCRSSIRSQADDHRFRQCYALSGPAACTAGWTYAVEANTAKATIVIHHAANGEVPAILEHLNVLWDRVLADTEPTVFRQALAEFEWWFMAANVTGRCGASIGDALSIMLQRHRGLPLRQHFVRLDWEVLSRPLPQYLAWRQRQLCRAHAVPSPGRAGRLSSRIRPE